MPPAAKKDCGLVLFDLASPQKLELLKGLLKFSTYKWFLNSRSIYRLILVNSTKSHNDKLFPNIYTTKLDNFDPKLIKQTIEKASTSSGASWIDALLLAIHHLEDAIDMPGLITLQLIFFTTLDKRDSIISDIKLNRVVRKLNEHNMFLYIIGPNVELPGPLTSLASISNYMNNLQVDSENPNQVAAKKIITSVTNGVMCSTKVGVHLLISYKNSPGTQPWKKPLTFGTKLAIPADVVKIFRKDISLMLAPSLPPRYHKILYDQRDKVVKEEDVVRGLVYHGKFVQINDELFKPETERSFEVIGFTHKKFVPETLLTGKETYYVLPDRQTEDGFQIFVHLVKVLHETEMYAISKRVYNNNTRASYYALIPNVEREPKCLTMTGLPFSDTFRPYKYETPTGPENVEEDDFSRFFNSLIVDNNESNLGITLGPTVMMDFHQQRIVNAVSKKYLKDKDFNMGSVDIVDAPPNNNFLENLRQCWPVRNIEEPPPSKH